MDIESIIKNPVVTSGTETNSVEKVNTGKSETVNGSIGKDSENQNQNDDNSVKQPTQATIESAFADINSKIKEHRTRCEYAYDEPTRRITIKVYDDETKELIREVPPEESLEALQKIWERAGIIVDKKL